MRYTFKTLEHSGVTFSDEYQPKGYKVAGEVLSPLAEEMLVRFSALRDTDYVKDSVFVKNFYSCLKLELNKVQKAIDFPKGYTEIINKIFDDLQKEKEEKAEYRKANKEQIKKEKDALKEKYGFALVDGNKVPLGNYMIEPEGIMMARGNSKTRGLWKYRVKPEDVVLNWKSDKKVPSAPKGHHWKEIESTNSQQIARYQIRVGKDFYVNKCILFSAQSDFKKNSDDIKFENARKLVKNWDKIEKYIEKGIRSKDAKTKECALISWLILQTGIRVGSDKDVRENGVVGASSLKVRNIEVD